MFYSLVRDTLRYSSNARMCALIVRIWANEVHRRAETSCFDAF